MMVLCAWCEQEGKQALIGRSAKGGRTLQSHGICEMHEERLMRQVQQLRDRGRLRQIPRRLHLQNARGSTSPITVMYL